jgi:hypothetical protein
MVAHGADPDKTDEETFRQICVMYADGLIGNRAMIETLGSLTGAVYNYMRSQNAPSYKLKSVIGRIYDYIYPPQDTTEAASDALLVFMTQAKGFNPSRFKVDK